MAEEQACATASALLPPLLFIPEQCARSRVYYFKCKAQMKWRQWIQVLGALLNFPLSLGQGTTVLITTSYCPPSGPIPTPQPTTGPFAPYYLSITDGLGGPSEYMDSRGQLTNISNAAQFTITSTGRLVVGNEFFSTNGSFALQPFTTASNTDFISTTFSAESGFLRWRNNAFEGGEALFCRINNTVMIYFAGTLLNDCRSVLIRPVLSSSLVEQSSSSVRPSGTLFATLTTVSIRYSSLGSPSSLSSKSFNTPDSSGAGSALSSTSSVPSAISTDRPASVSRTSTILTPVNLDTISTINSILDTTTLISSLTTGVGSVTVASSITTTSTIEPATTVGMTSSNTPSITTPTTEVITSQTNTPAESTEDQIPDDLPPSSTEGNPPTNPGPIVTTTVTVLDSSEPTPTLPTSLSTPSLIVPTSIGPTTTTEPTSTNEPIGIPQYSTPGSAASTSTPSALSCPILPLNTDPLCPQQSGGTYKLSRESSCYGVLCSTGLIGTVITANSTTTNNLRGCAAYCVLFNTAIPYSCLGVSYLGSTAIAGGSNCFLYGEVTGQITGVAGTDSMRLLFPGYPNLRRRDLYTGVEYGKHERDVYARVGYAEQ